jgi:hypothetical protein
MRKLPLAALATLTILAMAATDAVADNRCRVMDPTGTPLNVRVAPNGQIVGALPNGLLVSIVNMADDANGKPWAYIARFDDGRPIGWVFREFIACF